MKLASFSILTALSLVFAGLTLKESVMYQTWDQAVSEQKQIQAKITHFQRLNNFTEALLRRMVIESQHDPAIMTLLNDRQIKVVIKTADSTKMAPDLEATPGTPDKAAPAPPSPTPAPPSPTPAHP